MGVDLNKMPLVTVYIPTYNRINLLKRAINSVLAQTYCNYEIIVVDDNSNDGTQEYLKEIALENKKIRYFLKKENSGACVSRNIAISNAKGEFITGLDDDDYFDKNRIIYFVNTWMELEGELDFSGLYSDYYIISSKSIRISNTKEKVELKDLKVSNCIGNQVFTKTEILIKAELFDEKIPAWQDYEFWFRVVRDFGVMIKCSNTTYYMDESHNNIRISTSSKGKILDAYKIFVKKHILFFSKRERKILYLNCLNYQQINFSYVDFFDSIRYFYFDKILLVLLKKYWRRLKK